MTERNYKTVSDEELEEEKEIDQQHLQNYISIRGVTIKTIGELRKYITSVKIIKKFENKLSDDDYYYLAEWILFKEVKTRKY